MNKKSLFRTFEQLGIIDLTLNKPYQIKIDYFIEETNDDRGQILVKLIAQKGMKKLEKKIKIIGFKTKEKQIEEEVIFYINKIFDVYYTKHLNLLPNWNPNQIINLDQLGINIYQDSTVDLKFKVSSVNQNTGIVNGNLFLTKGNFSQNKLITVKNFKTLHQHSEQIIASFLPQLQKKFITKFKTKNVESFKLGLIKWNELGLDDLKNIDNISLNYEIIDINFDQGSLLVKVYLEKNLVVLEQKILVTGFIEKKNKDIGVKKNILDYLTSITQNKRFDLNQKINNDNTWEDLRNYVINQLNETFSTTLTTRFLILKNINQANHKINLNTKNFMSDKFLFFDFETQKSSSLNLYFSNLFLDKEVIESCSKKFKDTFKDVSIVDSQWKEKTAVEFKNFFIKKIQPTIVTEECMEEYIFVSLSILNKITNKDFIIPKGVEVILRIFSIKESQGFITLWADFYKNDESKFGFSVTVKGFKKVI